MIRPAKHSDVPRLIELGTILHESSSYSSMPFNPEKSAAFLHQLINGPNGVVFAAEIDGGVVGGMAGGIVDQWFCDELIAYDYSLFIEPVRRSGITAIRLLKAFEEWARLRGARHVQLGIGTQLNVPEGLQGSTPAIVIGSLVAIYGAMGLGQAVQNALNIAWSVPRNSRPNPFKLRLKSLLLLMTAGVAVLVVSALSTDAIMGSTAPLHPEIHALRGHAGQIEAAAFMRSLLDGSVIRESHRIGDTRVQDPYCIRCQPQVTGAAMDVLRQAARTLEIEANAATDNPLVLTSDGSIVSGGNFHAEPVGFAADMIALALSEIGAIAQRRVALMVDPVLSFDLPAFLTPKPGLNSGLMIAEVTTAALMSENKHLAHPTVTDSTPTSANQEDHVSMAAHGARRLGRMVANLQVILGVEAICAAQGVDFRAPLATSAPLQGVVKRLRQDVATLGDDRYMAPDLAAAANLIGNGALASATAIELPALA